MFDKLGALRPHMHLYSFVALLSLGNMLIFQEPLFSYIAKESDLHSFGGVMQLASTQVIQFCMLAALLIAISLLSQTVLKIVTSVLFLTNAGALYFMQTYGIEFDRSMIGNILNTDPREALNLWHPQLFIYVFFLGVLPAILILRTRLKMPRWYWRVLVASATLAVMLGWMFLNASTWLWFDKHASRMGGKLLPWSYIINTTRYFNQIALRDRTQILLPDASFLSDIPARKQIVVLVIGEAARAESFSHYGYARDTNPFTKETTLIALPAGLSCATNTIASTACILTHEGSDASPRTAFEPLPSYMTRHGIETVFRSNNTGPPPVKVTRYQRAGEMVANCADADCPQNGDAMLNWKLAEELTQSKSRRIFVTLHQTGSHGPAYSKKYPPDFEYFTPVCDTVQISECSKEQLYNAYDNTIRYTDYLLADLIRELETIKDADVAMIYVSDHGQSLGEGGFYLHGAPNAVAPIQQRRIPFLLWMSKSFQAARGLSAADFTLQESFPHDYVFHSVMGAFGMRSDIYKPQFDIFRKHR